MNIDLPLQRLFAAKFPLQLSPSEIMTEFDELKKSDKKSDKTPEQVTSQRNDSFQIATNLLISFKYAGQGVGYAFRTQRNFRIHLLVGAIAIGLSLYFRLSAIAFTVICLTIALVLVLELLNTALEAVVDLTVGREFHQLAKIAKDCAAGAVLIGAIAALVIACVLLMPSILASVGLSKLI